MSFSFYFQTSFYVAVWWILLCCTSQKPLYKATEGAVVTIPSWLPTQFVLLLQKFRPAVFNGATIGLALASSFYNVFEIRILAAVLYTLYHLAETSETNRHGEYPILYAMWAMSLENQHHRHACVWGIAIHFVLSTGYAKIAIGGLTKYGVPKWIHPDTMSNYLSGYRSARHRLNQPLFPKWNQYIADSNVCCSLLAFLTLMLECVVVPGTLLMEPSYRPIATFAMISMHIGIACVMSIKVGIVFITSIPAYVYGFSCTAAYASTSWQIAAAIGLGPTIMSILLLSLPENWPLTPVSLFMWNGETAQRILNLFMTGDTRMVLATQRVASLDILGLRVLHHGELPSSKEMETMEPLLHDAVLRVLGFTMVQGSIPLVEAILALKGDVDNATTTLVCRVGAWLSLERRLVEVHTGEPLSHVYFVRIDQEGRVAEVLI